MRKVCLLVVLLLCVLLGGCGNGNTYKTAVTLMEEKAYLDALPLLESIPDIKDAAQLAEECKNQIYNQAEALCNEERYEEALPLLSALTGYRDSDDRKTFCENKLAYANALELYEAGDYEKAGEAFAQLADFEDSAELAQNCEDAIAEALLYVEAVKLTEQGEYAEALEIFEAMRNPHRYKDASEYMTFCWNKLMLADPMFADLEKIIGIGSLEEIIEENGRIQNGGTGIGDARQLSCRIKNHQALTSPCVFERKDGTKMRLPMTYGELYEAGWRVEEEAYWSSYDFKGTALGDLLPAGEYNYLTMIHTGGDELRIRVENTSSDAMELRDVPVVSLDIGSGYEINGITMGSSIEVLLEKFGLPYGIVYTQYTEELKTLIFVYWENVEQDGEHLTVSIDLNTGTVNSMNYEITRLNHHI